MARHKELNDEQVLQDIYNAAVELIDSEGLDKISVRKICRMANISTGTFYHYYPTKGDLINRLIDHMENYYRDDVVPYLSGTGLDKMHVVMLAYVKRASRRGSSYSKWNVDFLINNRMTPEFFDDLYMFRLYRKVAQEAIDNGEITDRYNTFELCRMMQSVCFGCLMLYVVLDGKLDIIENEEKTISAFLTGLKK